MKFYIVPLSTLTSLIQDLKNSPISHLVGLAYDANHLKQLN